MTSVYTIASNFNGRQHSAKFYPAGYGYSYDDYITSFEQYQDLLKDKYEAASSYKVVYISASSEVKEIEDNYDLFKAAEDLNNGSCLSVTLIANKKKDNANKNKKRNKNENQQEDWNGDASDTEGEMTDYESSDDEEEYEAPAKQKNTGGKSAGKLQPILNRFVTHVGECHHCDRTEWNGARYEYSMHSGYSMCEECHANLSKESKKSWPLASNARVPGLPWEADVPEYPLYREEGCPIRDATIHLQYILTRIGLMSLSATDSLIGSYQSNTERAIEKFRKQYKINGDDMTVYNKKTAGKLGEIVRKLRSEGHKYI